MKEIDALIADVLDPNAELADRHRAFGEIIARFQDMAFACAYAILKDCYLAEDVAQESFIVAWQKLDQLKDPRAFPGWFKKIVFSQCHRLTRGKRLLVMPLETGLSVPSNSPDPHALVENIELSETVLAAIRALPDGERMVTTLFYIDGYSQNDISDFLELRSTTVAKRLFSARRRLKQGLIGMLEEDLKQRRPSRHDAFADQIQARLRPFAEQDWEIVTSIVYGIEPDSRADNDSWLRNRKQFDEGRYIRRHYVAQHAENGQILGYGSIEQTIFLPKYRLFLVVAPEHLRSGVGELLLDQLMKDLQEANAIAVWYRSDARLTDTLDFLKDRGFVETNEKLGFRRHFTYVTLEKCLKEVKAIDTGVYDDYAGRYAFQARDLEKHKLPADLRGTVKKVGARLISEIRDMQDELFPESQNMFFIKMHYGQVEFIRDAQGHVTGLIYHESGKQMRADKLK